jgi:glycosyltransferase involved in cell wall biosynthesis
VLPSYREGTPKALLEAAACARPIVTTDVTGCRQVIENGVEGYIVPARSSAGLADAMQRLADDKELRHKMGAAARVRAEARFGQEGVVEAHFLIYRALTGIN